MKKTNPAYKQTMPAPRYSAIEVAKKLAELGADANGDGGAK